MAVEVKACGEKENPPHLVGQHEMYPENNNKEKKEGQ